MEYGNWGLALSFFAIIANLSPHFLYSLECTKVPKVSHTESGGIWKNCCVGSQQGEHPPLLTFLGGLLTIAGKRRRDNPVYGQPFEQLLMCSDRFGNLNHLKHRQIQCHVCGVRAYFTSWVSHNYSGGGGEENVWWRLFRNVNKYWIRCGI